MFVKELLTTPRLKTRDGLGDPDNSTLSHHEHLPKASDLPAYARNCSLCALFMQDVKAEASYSKKDIKETLGNLPSKLTLLGGDWFSDRVNLYRLIFTTDPVTTNRFFRIYKNPDDSSDVLKDLFSSPPFLPGSEVSFSWIQKCLNHCITNHEHCKVAISGATLDDVPLLPTRVLDLQIAQGESRIQLVESSGSRAPYNSLSYCWGQQKKKWLQTTRANLKQNMNSMSIRTLPKTYRDAITVTRNLGVRYLWIDALCIIQDDSKDWSQECQKMGQYYESARLVIAASGAKDPSEGCFLQPSFLPKVVLPLYQDGVAVSSFTVELSADSEDDDPCNSPLHERAWATQEWWLARRTVHFLRAGLVWACNAYGNDEVPFAVSDNGCSRDLEMYRDWDIIVNNYTMRSLSHQSDKLAALQGLANSLQQTNQDKYVMGLWARDLPRSLLWLTGIYNYTERIEELTRFPSWTWASVHGNVIPWKMENIAEDSATLYGILDETRKLSIEAHTVSGIIAHRHWNCVDNMISQYTLTHGARDVISPEAIVDDDEVHIGWASFDEAYDYGEHTVNCLCIVEDTPQQTVTRKPPERGEQSPEKQKRSFHCLIVEPVEDDELQSDIPAETWVPTFRRYGVAHIVKAFTENELNQSLVYLV